MTFRILVLSPADTPGFIVELSFENETIAGFETDAPPAKKLLLYGRKSGEPWTFSLEDFQQAWKGFIERSREILAETNEKE